MRLSRRVIPTEPETAADVATRDPAAIRVSEPGSGRGVEARLDGQQLEDEHPPCRPRWSAFDRRRTTWRKWEAHRT